MIAGIVLAAGGSRRMGRPKMPLPLGAGTVLSESVGPLLAAGIGRAVVVLGADADAVRASAGLPADPRLRVVVNAKWRDGLSSSLRRGLAECEDAEAVLVALGDQPGMTVERVEEVLGAFAPGVSLVVPVTGTVPSHPVLFSRDLFGELRALTGDSGARAVVRRHWEGAIRIAVEPLSDVDTEEDYRKALAAEAPR